ncbi:MAG: hypothetical protein K0B05_05840 [Bacteroidales bacterium]|nr:hypothetical protein [Bacteroidales bacterium]
MNIIKSISTALLLAVALIAQAQKGERQTVVLHDGTILTGTIVADSSDYLMMRIKRPQVIMLKKSQIYSADIAKPAEQGFEDKQGYSIRLSASVLAGRNSDGKTGGLSFHLSNGYQFRSGISIGFGTGIEELDAVVMPVYADLRYQPLKTRVSPFIWVKSGYGFPVGDQGEGGYYYYGYYPDAKGGGMFNTGAGIALYSWRRNAVNIGIGYRYQKMRYIQEYPWGGESNNEVITHFNRVEVQFGFIFR